MTNHKLFIIILFCFLSACTYAKNSNVEKTAAVNTNNQSPALNTNDLLRKQILLTNAAKFTNNRILEGASGFLIKINGGNFAVTARHLLGEASGVEPEIKINDLSKSLLSWDMMPRSVTKTGKETVKLDAKGLDYSQSLSDIVLLKVISNDFEIETLAPNYDLPSVSETLYLIGCPYSETKCRQNVYPVKYVEFDEKENALVCEINSKVNLAGFSGAPLINGKGEAVGVLVSGGAVGQKDYVLATHIKEIQKITF